MPVITRSQSKVVARSQNKVVTQNQSKVTNETKEELEEFVKDLTYLIYCCDKAVGKDKMEICLHILQRINIDLPVLIERTSITMWLNFVLALQNKVDEWREQFEATRSQYDKTMAKWFHTELYRAKILTISIIEYRRLP